MNQSVMSQAGLSLELHCQHGSTWQCLSCSTRLRLHPSAALARAPHALDGRQAHQQLGGQLRQCYAQLQTRTRHSHPPCRSHHNVDDQRRPALRHAPAQQHEVAHRAAVVRRALDLQPRQAGQQRGEVGKVGRARHRPRGQRQLLQRGRAQQHGRQRWQPVLRDVGHAQAGRARQVARQRGQRVALQVQRLERGQRCHRRRQAGQAA
mmetsp:Transcript_8685/g.21512  ORF Transcript_8685/g.21512 Transcript_8685/m.21512 type:complete len:207 (-) Transcript_8685:1469-2089(-)